MYYSDERNVQILVYLLKAHGICDIVASPGTTNMCFVGSVQSDSFFNVYSCVDERSAAYMACGIAEKTGKPVVLSCTGATASRNYYPGLTEAYNKKLPIIAVTSHQGTHRIGHLIDQNIDRRVLTKELVKLSVDAVVVKDSADRHYCELEINKAILESMRHGGGPVHINLFTRYSQNFSVKELPKARVIKRYSLKDNLPNIPKGRVAVFVGSHRMFSDDLKQSIDTFCMANSAVVFYDHTSGYNGDYGIHSALMFSQVESNNGLCEVNLLIHIGEVSGDSSSKRICPQQVWRVSEDGEIRDTWGKLTTVFEMDEVSFFKEYSENGEVKGKKNQYLDDCKSYDKKIRSRLKELPFSNIWIASQLSNDIPEGSKVFYGILNSLRSWNYFNIPNCVVGNSNVGGFGIDGGMSTMIGSSLIDTSKIHFLFIGDLAFFYDVNALMNSGIRPNIRILVVNNGRGVEMRNSHSNASVLGDEGDLYLAAAGHFGDKSQSLIRNFASETGFDYYSASNKEEFIKLKDVFMSPHITNKPILFEVFVNYKDEDAAYRIISHIDVNKKVRMINYFKSKLIRMFGNHGIMLIKEIVGGGVILCYVCVVHQNRPVLLSVISIKKYTKITV